MTQDCKRCGDDFERPVESSLNYVRASDFVEEERVEVTYGVLHTEETLSELDRLDDEFEDRDRQALSAEAAHPDAELTVESVRGVERVENDDGTFVETSKKAEVDFSIPIDKFRHIEVESPEEVKEDDKLALTYVNREARPVEKTGLVCSECVSDEDDIIWGPDK